MSGPDSCLRSCGGECDLRFDVEVEVEMQAPSARSVVANEAWRLPLQLSLFNLNAILLYSLRARRK